MICIKCFSFTGNGISWRTGVLQYCYSLWYTVIVIRYKEFTRDLYKNMDRKIATFGYAGRFKKTMKNVPPSTLNKLFCYIPETFSRSFSIGSLLLSRQRQSSYWPSWF